MLQKTIPLTLVYYQLNIYSLSLKYTKEDRWIRVHFQNTNGNVQIGAIKVHQGGSLSQLESFSMVYVLQEHLSQLGTYIACSVYVDRGHVAVSGSIPQFEVLESRW